MSKPPTILEAVERGLLAPDGAGIHTFSNGTEWECWSGSNCDECRWFDPDTAGGLCAFEGAAFIGQVSPELARLFGWLQDPQWDKPDDHRHGWQAPESCRFFRSRTDDNGDDRPPPPPIDPNQLVLLADPTEDAAMLTAHDAPVAVEVSA